MYAGIFVCWDLILFFAASGRLRYGAVHLFAFVRQYYVFTNKAAYGCKKFEVIFRYNSLACKKKIVNMFYIWIGTIQGTRWGNYNLKDKVRIEDNTRRKFQTTFENYRI